MPSLLGSVEGKTDSFEHLPLLQGITGGLVYLEPVSEALRKGLLEGRKVTFLPFITI
jgi:hypothetical protein